mmetsp:Transcript_63454/g.137378  ORF Transcript_63454/g.137378 Transcript_63454/m.137378 type:complete len:508 (-) Transcript_63454:13-1536(-)
MRSKAVRGIRIRWRASTGVGAQVTHQARGAARALGRAGIGTLRGRIGTLRGPRLRLRRSGGAPQRLVEPAVRHVPRLLEHLLEVLIVVDVRRDALVVALEVLWEDDALNDPADAVAEALEEARKRLVGRPRLPAEGAPLLGKHRRVVPELEVVDLYRAVPRHVQVLEDLPHSPPPPLAHAGAQEGDHLLVGRVPTPVSVQGLPEEVLLALIEVKGDLAQGNEELLVGDELVAVIVHDVEAAGEALHHPSRAAAPMLRLDAEHQILGLLRQPHQTRALVRRRRLRRRRLRCRRLGWILGSLDRRRAAGGLGRRRHARDRNAEVQVPLQLLLEGQGEVQLLPAVLRQRHERRGVVEPLRLEVRDSAGCLSGRAAQGLAGGGQQLVQLQWSVPCRARGRGRGNSSPIGVGTARSKRSDAGADRWARRLAREPAADGPTGAVVRRCTAVGPGIVPPKLAVDVGHLELGPAEVHGVAGLRERRPDQVPSSIIGGHLPPWACQPKADHPPSLL